MLFSIGNKSVDKNPHIPLTVYNGIWIAVSQFPAKHSLINKRGKTVLPLKIKRNNSSIFFKEKSLTTHREEVEDWETYLAACPFLIHQIGTCR